MVKRLTRCPECDGLMEMCKFVDGVTTDESPDEFNSDWWCPACRLRWMSVKGEPVEAEDR